MLPVSVPALKVHVVLVATVPGVMVHDVSPVLKPLPLTVTTVPAGAELGMKLIDGEVVVTVNVACAESPVLPVTVIVCAPNVALLRTVNEPVTTPPGEVEHEGEVTMLGNGVLAIVQLESAVLNPLPVTVTTVRTGPKLGLSETDGVVLVTVNAACAKSPLLPVT